MNEQLYQISVDFDLILRLFLAFLWGIGWALFLHYHHIGQDVVKNKTWLAVVVGIGVDLLIAYNADWWTVSGVIAASSIGIIWRSLSAESQQQQVNYNAHHVKWGIMDATAMADDMIKKLAGLLREHDPQTLPAAISELLGTAYAQREILRAARQGRLVEKNG
jgi:hypothetical protein